MEALRKCHDLFVARVAISIALDAPRRCSILDGWKYLSSSAQRKKMEESESNKIKGVCDLRP
jgi:hypothetical protein